MARYTSYQPNEYGLPDLTDVSPTVATDTKIVFKVGDFKIVFTGTFSYDASGNPSGTLDTMRINHSDVLLEKVTGINKDAGDAFTAYGTGDLEACYAFIFDEDDVFIGNNIYNDLAGGNGNDTLRGGNSFDELFGGKGSDTLYGKGGHDLLNGQNGNDVLYGGAGHDALVGGRGNDTLYGGAGKDEILGGAGGSDFLAPAGDDTLFGGAGNDTFYFIAEGGGNHVIKDFTDGEDILFLLNYGITSATEARSYASNIDGDTVFDFGSGNTITVENVDKSIFRAADFGLSTLDDLMSA